MTSQLCSLSEAQLEESTEKRDIGKLTASKDQSNSLFICLGHLDRSVELNVFLDTRPSARVGTGILTVIFLASAYSCGEDEKRNSLHQSFSA